MSEEKHNLQHKADRAKPGSKRSVFTYMLILFLAAFVLLLFAYMMQQRSSVDAIDGLTDSVSAIQTAQEVYEENSKLRNQIDQLEDQVSQLEETLQATQNELTDLERSNSLLQGEHESLTNAAVSTAQALDWFWQINEAYVRGRYSTARILIENMNNAGLVEFLPRESATNNGRFSPYERYMEIYDALY